MLCAGEYREQVFFFDGFADGYFSLLYPAQSLSKYTPRRLTWFFCILFLSIQAPAAVAKTILLLKPTNYNRFAWGSLWPFKNKRGFVWALRCRLKFTRIDFSGENFILHFLLHLEIESRCGLGGFQPRGRRWHGCDSRYRQQTCRFLLGILGLGSHSSWQKTGGDLTEILGRLPLWGFGHLSWCSLFWRCMYGCGEDCFQFKYIASYSFSAMFEEKALYPGRVGCFSNILKYCVGVEGFSIVESFSYVEL